MTGDHREFLELTLPDLDAVFQVARHAARGGLDPEDLVQETYLRAFASFSRYRGRARVAGRHLPERGPVGIAPPAPAAAGGGQPGAA